MSQHLLEGVNEYFITICGTSDRSSFRTHNLIGFKPPLSRREAWILKFFDSSGPLSAGKYVQILGFLDSAATQKKYVQILGRHEICQKFYIAGFSGQKFYTLNFNKSQQF